MKQKRRLGAIGRDGKGKLMPSWESVRRLPLHRIRHQLARWTRVSLHTVLRGGQRTLNGYVTRARDATKRPANDDDDGSRWRQPASSGERTHHPIGPSDSRLFMALSSGRLRLRLPRLRLRRLPAD